jgi:callose synthase
LQIKPLVKPTNIIVDLPSLDYSWHDLVSKSKFIIICLLL